MSIGFSKEQQLARYTKRKEAKTAKEKGEVLEHEVKTAFGKKARKNHQGKTGGGIGNPDVSAMRDWHLEVKNTERLSIPEWLKTLKAETPNNKKPGLVFAHDGEPWLTIRLADRVNFAAGLVEAAGFDVVPR